MRLIMIANYFFIQTKIVVYSLYTCPPKFITPTLTITKVKEAVLSRLNKKMDSTLLSFPTHGSLPPVHCSLAAGCRR